MNGAWLPRCGNDRADTDVEKDPWWDDTDLWAPGACFLLQPARGRHKENVRQLRT